MNLDKNKILRIIIYHDLLELPNVYNPCFCGIFALNRVCRACRACRSCSSARFFAINCFSASFRACS